MIWHHFPIDLKLKPQLHSAIQQSIRMKIEIGTFRFLIHPSTCRLRNRILSFPADCYNFSVFQSVTNQISLHREEFHFLLILSERPQKKGTFFKMMPFFGSFSFGPKWQSDLRWSQLQHVLGSDRGGELITFHSFHNERVFRTPSVNSVR